MFSWGRLGGFKLETNEVHAAFEILLEEIEAIVSGLNESGAEAFRVDDYDKARQTVAQAESLADFRDKIKALQREWNTLSNSIKEPMAGKRKITRRFISRLPRGLRTPEEAFRIPILETLIELGGSGRAGEVLDRVESKMNNVLNSYDKEPLPSDPRTARWRNTAQWCRNTLVREGLMKSDSPVGVWEISERGRKWLKDEGT